MGNPKLKSEIEDLDLDLDLNEELDLGESVDINLASAADENKSLIDSQLDLFEDDSILIAEKTNDANEHEDNQDLSDYKTEIESLDDSNLKSKSIGKNNTNQSLEAEISNIESLDVELDTTNSIEQDLKINDVSDKSKPSFSDSSYDELSIGSGSQDSTMMLNVGGDSADEAEADVSSEQISEPDISQFDEVNSVFGDSSVNWKDYVQQLDAPDGAAADLLRRAFADSLDKHIALQTVATIKGEYKDISTWQYSVWRNGHQRTYPHDGRKRISQSVTDPLLKSDLRSMIESLSPLFVKIYPDHFSLAGLSKKVKKSESQLHKSSSLLAWDSPELGYFGFARYAQRFAERQYYAFNCPHAGDQIYFDGKSRSFYFDVSFFAQQPIGNLFYGILTKIWSLRLGYYVFTNLNPIKDVVPVIEKLKDKISSTSKFSLNLGGDAYTKFLNSPAGNKARMYDPVILEYKPEQLFALYNAMQDHVYKLLLADTLDLIGMVEYICHIDLVKNGKQWTYKNLEKKSIHFVKLFNHFVSLKV